MKEQLVSFETAKLAKEKKFDWNCTNAFMGEKIPQRNSILSDWNSAYDWSFSAPTQSLLQAWLREIHNIDCWAAPFLGEKSTGYSGIIFQNRQMTDVDDNCDANTYEEAVEKALLKSLKLITK